MRGGRAGGEGVPDTGSLHKPVESESLAHSDNGKRFIVAGMEWEMGMEKYIGQTLKGFI